MAEPFADMGRLGEVQMWGVVASGVSFCSHAACSESSK